MKLIFFDIDGTLITDDGRRLFPEDAKEAIKAARAAGNLVFINTGRVRCNVEAFITDPGFDGLVCGCGTYIEYRGEVIHHRRMSKEDCHRIAHLCRDCRMQAFFEYAYGSFYDGEMDLPYILPLVRYMEGSGRTIGKDIDAEEFVFDKFSGWFDQSSDVDRFKKGIEGIFTYIDRGPDFFEVEPVGCSKASGIDYLLRYFHISREDVYVFGDGNNDLEMMQFAGHSIAMGNGNANARAAAEYVTSDIEDGGIRQGLQHFQLI